jgi:hypothetical protein
MERNSGKVKETTSFFASDVGVNRRTRETTNGRETTRKTNRRR